MKVAVGASSFGEGDSEAVKLLEEKGIELVKNPYGRRMTRQEIKTQLKGADGLLAGLEPLDEEVLSTAPGLKAIARIGIGMDNVDISAAKRLGIRVSNTPDAPTQAVAEMTLSALLCLCHQLWAADRDVHNGVWKKRMGRSIRGLKVLVIGCGRIGRRSAALLSSLGAHVMIYDNNAAVLPDAGQKRVSLMEGLRVADAVTLHASGTEEILTPELFEVMKQGVILLNSARGALINENALYRALRSGRVSAFWGDALWSEPYEGVLTECENALLTPHLSTYTTVCREEMELQAVQNLLEDLGYV